MSDPAKILIIDDEEGIRKSLRNLLEDEGYTVDTAEKGQEAIEKSKEKFYNLALIDIRLPDIDGTKLLKTIKDTTPRMIKMMITGYPSLDNAVQAVNEGADAYIMKPLDPPSLLQKIEEQLKKQKEEQEYSQDKVADFIESRVREIKKEKE